MENGLSTPVNRRRKDEALMELWEDQNFKANASTERSYQNFRRKNCAPNSGRHRKVYLAQMAAGGGCITGSPALWWHPTYIYNRMKSIQNLSSTMCPEANKNRLPCPTGTTAYLNSGTLLVYPQKVHRGYPFGISDREANFDVKKDKQHPFIVKTNHLKVKVLGTKFNVHAYAEDEKTTTTLESGSVVVQKANNEDIITLTPNEQLEYDNPSGEFNKKIIDASVYPAGPEAS